MKLFLTVALSLMAIAWIAHAQQPSPNYPPPPPPSYYQPPPPPPPPATTEIIPPMPPSAPPAYAPQAVPPPPPPPVANQAPLPSGPQPQQQGNVTFVSGGAGDEDRAALKQMESQYNLRLLFVERSGNYLANIAVTLADARGNAVLDTIAEGPIFYAHLPPGRYKLTVSNHGQSQSRDVIIGSREAVHQDFYWSQPS
jgi:hypothetical protein